jgi:hypothetical protein
MNDKLTSQILLYLHLGEKFCPVCIIVILKLVKKLITPFLYYIYIYIG